jgi:hypothetical protein
MDKNIMIEEALKLLERYKSLEGFPEEMNGDNVSGVHFRSGYNYCLEQCKLALLKKIEGITPEFLHNEYLKTVKHLHPESFNPVANKPYDELTDEQKSIDIFIAQAIKDHLTK